MPWWISGCEFNTKDSSIEFRPWTSAREKLKTFGAPDGAYKVSNIEFDDRDGTKPETAWYDYKSSMSQSEIESFYKKRCEVLNFEILSDDEYKYVPDIFCKTETTEFHLSIQCEANDDCSIFAQILQ